MIPLSVNSGSGSAVNRLMISDQMFSCFFFFPFRGFIFAQTLAIYKSPSKIFLIVSHHPNSPTPVFTQNFVNFLNVFVNFWCHWSTIIFNFRPYINRLCHSKTWLRDMQLFLNVLLNNWKRWFFLFFLYFMRNLRLMRCLNFNVVPNFSVQ